MTKVAEAEVNRDDC